MRHPIRLRVLSLAAAIVVMGAATHAGAQSFDCEAGFSRVEQMICGDAALSQLDVDMASAYAAALKAAPNRQDLLRGQRTWLARRDACADTACVAAAYRERLGVIAPAPPAGWLTYRNASMGISFELPADRHVGPCENTPGPSCVGLKGRFGGATTELAAFQAFDGPLEAVATDQAGFEPHDGKWMTTYGRSAPHEVERFSTGGLNGMRATVTCGISDAQGFHAAGGECIYVVVSNGRRSVMASTDGVGGNDAATARSIASVRLDR